MSEAPAAFKPYETRRPFLTVRQVDRHLVVMIRPSIRPIEDGRTVVQARRLWRMRNFIGEYPVARLKKWLKAN